MKATLLALLLGFVVGAAGVTIIAKMSAPPPPPPGPSPEEVAQLKQDLATTRTKVQQLEEVNADLAASLAKLKQSAVTASTAAEPATTAKEERKPGDFLKALFGGSDTNRSNAIRKMMQAGMKSHMDTRIAALKRRLNLTPDQEQKVRDLFDRQYGQGMEMAGKLFEGKLSKDEMAKAGENQVDFKGELQNILTPEQWTAYETYQTEQRQSRAQMMANMELSQMQNTLGIDQNQQQKVFDVLYQQSLQQTGDWEEGRQPNPANWQQNWEQREQAKLDALRTVLTPEQYQSYEQQQKNQREMIKSVTESFIGKDGTKGEVQVLTAPQVIVEP